MIAASLFKCVFWSLHRSCVVFTCVRPPYFLKIHRSDERRFLVFIRIVTGPDFLFWLSRSAQTKMHCSFSPQHPESPPCFSVTGFHLHSQRYNQSSSVNGKPGRLSSTLMISVWVNDPVTGSAALMLNLLLFCSSATELFITSPGGDRSGAAVILGSDLRFLPGSEADEDPVQ